MPIYEYRCESCGHQQEFLRKVSDPPHTICPKCNKPTFSKLLTAAGFQLKGSGWYATDFKSKASAPAKADAPKPDDKKSGETKSGETKSGETKSGETKSEAVACGAGACPACR